MEMKSELSLRHERQKDKRFLHPAKENAGGRECSERKNHTRGMARCQQDGGEGVLEPAETQGNGRTHQGNRETRIPCTHSEDAELWTRGRRNSRRTQISRHPRASVPRRDETEAHGARKNVVQKIA